MKKTFYFIILLIFILGFISSLELISLNGEVFAGETYIGYFDAELKNILKKEDVKIYEERREVYFEKGVYFYKNKTFIYVIFPKEGNFSITTKNFLYYENKSLKEGKINKTIRVSGNNTKILEISPGILLGEEIFVSLSNKGRSDLKIKFQDKEFILKGKETKIVKVNSEEEFFYLEIESYKNFKIPVISFSSKNEENKSFDNKTQKNETIKKTLNKIIEINETKIEKYFEVNKTEVFSLLIKNIAEKEINITFKTKMKNLEFSENISLSPFEERPFFLKYSPNITGNFEENLNIYFEKEELNVSLKFYVITSESLEILENLNSENKKISSCEEINGTLCIMTGYSCKNGNNIPLLGIGFCCVGGECVKIEEKKDKPISNYIVGSISLAMVVILLYLILKKYKKVKPEGLRFGNK